MILSNDKKTTWDDSIKEPQIQQMKTDFSAYSQTIRVSKLKTATMGKKLYGRLFHLYGKAFRINGEVFRVYGKLFHRVFSSCEGSFLAIIGIFRWVLQ